jgi:NTP pyrophosphatase (non-canonical NTP hydrolase)
MLNKLSKQVHENAKKKGFLHEEKPNIGEKLALVHSEVSEALEAAREGKIWDDVVRYERALKNGVDATEAYKEFIKPTMQTELADVIIRVLDICGYYALDIEKSIKMKMEYNSTRPPKHGKAF